MFNAGFGYVVALGLALSAAASVGRSVARPVPNSCALVTVAEVAAVVGKPVTGGQVSTVNDPSSPISNCLYQAGAMLIVVRLAQFSSVAEAKSDFSDEMSNEPHKPTLEAGVGDAAYSSTVDATTVGWLALHGSRVVGIGFAGPGASTLPHDRVRSLMLTALSR